MADLFILIYLGRGGVKFMEHFKRKTQAIKLRDPLAYNETTAHKI
jgi:hypothetical protein